MEDPRTSFRNTLTKFLNNLGNVFDDDPRIPAVQEKLNTVDTDILMEKFHAAVKPYEEDLKSRNANILNEIEYLKHIDMSGKFNDPEFDTESRENFWLYVEKLYSFTKLHTAIPSGLRDNVFNLAKEVSETGDISIAFQKAKDMAENMTEKDSQEIVSSLQGLIQSIPPEVIQNVMNNPQVMQMMQQNMSGHGMDSKELMSQFNNLMQKK